MMMQDVKTIENELMKKTTKYTINPMEISEEYPQEPLSESTEQSL